MKKKLLLPVFLLVFTNLIANTPPGLSVSISCNSNGCHVACNQSTGSLTANPQNGTAPYSYLWSTAATTQTVNNLPVGVYTVTVYDAIGDSASSYANISNSGNSLVAAPVAIPYTIFSCDNQCTGWIRYDEYYLYGTPPYAVTTTSGTVNYNPQYPNGAAFTIENICLGANLSITVTDALGCTGQSMPGWFGLPNDYVFNPTFNITPTCFSMANGSIEVTGTGTTWYYSTMVKLTTDTNTAYNPNDLSDWWNTQYYLPPFDNLLPGTYYLGVIFNYTYPADAYPTGCIDFNYCYHGCPKYVAVTVPDLGPNCSTVEGDVFMDVNANCLQDTGDAGVPGAFIEFTPGPYYAYTDASGHYTSALPWGNYNVTHYPPYYAEPFCPSVPVPVALSFSNMADTVNFADTNAAPLVPPIIPYDVNVSIGHTGAHPGFNFVYGINVHKTSITSTGMITATLDYDPLLSFVSANPAPFSTSPGQVVWQLNPVPNYQPAHASVTVSVPPNPALIGDTLTASVNIQAANPDTNLANNTASTWHIITGSFDPNVKTVEQPDATFIPATDGLFNYTIQFQNTGNDTAFNVEVIDTLDSDLDVITFVPGASSHSCSIDITGQGVIHFYFNNIYLPDSTTDEPRSHGFVSFQIRCKPNRTHGTSILNHSDIVFDFNPPVATNTTTNTVDLTLAVQASATTICAGQQVTLTMIPELQNTPWRWRTASCSGALAGTGNSITVSPTVSTTYFVRDSAGTIPLGSCYRKTIIVQQPPAANVTAGGPLTFCQGGSVTLTSSSANSYLWSTGATTQNINVTASGNYSVIVSSSAGCSATSSSVTVTVNPLPTAYITPSGPTTFCQGNSVTLTSSAASSYLWSNSSASQSINVTSSGNYIVTVTDGNSCSATASQNITVNPLPTASITPSGPTTFCQGNSVTLTSSLASSYSWSNSSLSQSINVTSSGNYFVTVTDGNNCTASSSAISVTVNPLPNASITPSGPTTFCQGNSVTLTSSAASSYLWSNSSATQSINVTSSGNYIVTVTDANNCSSASPTTTVTVNPNPPVPAITQNGDSLISDLASGYQWYFNSVLISGATSQSYHPPQNGNYYVVITDANNCTASSVDYPFILTATGKLAGDNEITIHPNPARGELVVVYPEFGDKSEIAIYNLLGENLLSKKPAARSQQQVIDVSALPRGIYFIKVKLEEKIVLKKIVLM